jgi:hypothetical protein
MSLEQLMTAGSIGETLDERKVNLVKNNLFIESISTSTKFRNL